MTQDFFLKATELYKQVTAAELETKRLTDMLSEVSKHKLDAGWFCYIGDEEHRIILDAEIIYDAVKNKLQRLQANRDSLTIAFKEL